MKRMLLSMALVLFAACGGESSSGGTDPQGGGKEDTIFPTGDENLGYLRVEPADGSALGLVAVTPIGMQLEGAEVVFGAKRRLVEGTHYLQLASNGSNYSGAAGKVTKKLETVVTLAGLHVDGSLDLPTTFGPPIFATWPWNELVLGQAQQAGRFLPLGPGDYAFAVRVGTGAPYWSTTATLAEGEVKTITLLPDDPRATLRLVQPSRAFSDSANEAWLSTGSYQPEVLLQYMHLSQAYREKYLRSSANSSAQVRKLGTVDLTVVASPVHPSPYFLWLNGTYKKYEVKPGAIVDLEVRRLDVDNVLVTREDGTTFLQKGNYSVEWRQPDGSYLTSPPLQLLPTQTGVDLVPGHYRVTVNYTTAEPPGPKQDVHEIDLM